MDRGNLVTARHPGRAEPGVASARAVEGERFNITTAKLYNDIY
jgi:hypothetical protein